MFVKVKGAIGRKELQTAMVAPFVINLSMTGKYSSMLLATHSLPDFEKGRKPLLMRLQKRGHLSEGKVRLLHEQNDLSEPYFFPGRFNRWQGHRLNACAKTTTGVR